jgi:hypothetical protein
MAAQFQNLSFISGLGSVFKNSATLRSVSAQSRVGCLVRRGDGNDFTKHVRMVGEHIFPRRESRHPRHLRQLPARHASGVAKIAELSPPRKTGGTGRFRLHHPIREKAFYNEDTARAASSGHLHPDRSCLRRCAGTTCKSARSSGGALAGVGPRSATLSPPRGHPKSMLPHSCAAS